MYLGFIRAAVAMAGAAALGFVVVAVHEFDYASSHPHAFGPAKVIAWGAIAGALSAAAVALLGYAFAKGQSSG